MEEKKMNSQQIEGRNAVMEAFRSGKPIDKVYILDGNILEFPRDHPF